MITTTATDIQNNFGKYLTGILKKDYNEKDIRAERIAEKYENID